MRTIKKIHDALYNPIADLITYTPLPSGDLAQIDPFLFLNHHGPQVYKGHNNGLPFGPHPHRGMETLTFILDGDILHRDNKGHESIIQAGGVQWMVAGSGLMHAEVSSTEFKRRGGNLEILQLWINLPSNLKMIAPAYYGFQKEQIPSVNSNNGLVKINIIAGSFNGTEGAYTPLHNVQFNTLEFKPDGKLSVKVPTEHNVFLYVVHGNFLINENNIVSRQLVEFENDNEQIILESLNDGYILFGHAKPLGEPVAAHGPFVMNTMDEIRDAYADLKAGKFGEL